MQIDILQHMQTHKRALVEDVNMEAQTPAVKQKIQKLETGITEDLETGLDLGMHLWVHEC